MENKRYLSFFFLSCMNISKSYHNMNIYIYIYTTLARSWSGSIPVPMSRRFLTIPVARLPWSWSRFSVIPRSRSTPPLAPGNVRVRTFAFLWTGSRSISAPRTGSRPSFIPGTWLAASGGIRSTAPSVPRVGTGFPLSPGTRSWPFPCRRDGSRSTAASGARSTPFSISRSRSVLLAGPIIARRPWTILFTWRLYRSRPGFSFPTTLGRTRPGRLSPSRFTSTLRLPLSIITLTNFARSFLLHRVTARVRARGLGTARFGIGWPRRSIGLCRIWRHDLLLWTLSAAR